MKPLSKLTIILLSAGALAGGSSVALGSLSSGVVNQPTHPAPGVSSSNGSSARSNVSSQLVSYLPSRTSIESQIHQSGISVVIDSNTVSLETVSSVVQSEERTAAISKLNSLLVEDKNGVSNSQLSQIATTVSPYVNFINSAISYVVFEQFVFEYAISRGNEVPYALAQSEAQTSWRNYQKALSSGPVSGGRLTQADFVSTAAILGVQRSLTIGKEEQIIAGPPSPSVDRTPKFQSWMLSQIGSHSILISGVKGVNGSQLVNYLPKNI